MVPKKLLCATLSLSVLAGAAVVSIPAVAQATPGLAPDRTLVVGDDASTVRAVSRGSAATAAGLENRWFRHTDKQPTGRYVAAGDRLTVTVPQGAPTIELATGLYGVHASQNGGKDVGVSVETLTTGVNEVTAKIDGMVFLQNRSGPDDVVVEVEGGRPVPTWVQNETTRAEFDAQLADWAEAPFVEVVGDRVLVDFQASIGRPGLSGASKDVDALIETWDTAVELTNDTYGLLDATGGVAHKSGLRVYIGNPDIASATAYASANDDRLLFPNKFNGGKELIDYGLTGKRHWGLYHEIGHTYQPKELRWSGMAEVTVNISSLAVEEKLGFPSTIETDATRRKVASYRESPAAERDFDAVEDAVKLVMFDQLRRSFGDDFYARLAQEWRVEKALGTALKTDDTSLKQHFAQSASRVADRDLTPFFAEWGFDLSPETKDALGHLPKLQHEIWNNLDRKTDVVEREVEYVVPDGDLTVAPVKATLGQQMVDEGAASVTGLSNTDGSAGAEHVDSTVTALKDGERAGALNAVLGNETGVRNVLSAKIDVTPGNLLRFNGIERSGPTTVADLALDARSSTLRALSRGVKAHDFFPNEEYFGVDIIAPTGRVVTSASVQGQETAARLAEKLDHYAYRNGQYIVARHAEANSRLIRFDRDEQQPKNAAKTQAFRIVDDRLVPVALAGVPSCADDCAPTASVDGPVVEGTSVTVRGENFVAGETVSLHSDRGGLEGEATVAADGSVEVLAWLGSDMKPGDYTLSLHGPSSKATATTSLTVTEKADEVSPPGGQCGVVPQDA